MKLGTVAWAVAAIASQANGARVGLMGDTNKVEWTPDQINQASLSNSILHLASLPVPGDAEHSQLPSINAVHPPQSVLVALIEGSFQSTTPLAPAEYDQWDIMDLYSNMGDAQGCGMSWSHDSNLHTSSSSNNWAFSGAFDTPSKELNGDLVDIVRDDSNNWKITSKDDSLLVHTDSSWETHLLSEITHIKQSSQKLSVVTIQSIGECAKSESSLCPLASSLIQAALQERATAGSTVVLVSELDGVEGHRRLADDASPTVSPTVSGQLTSNYTINEIVQFQINLWASIGLVLVLLSAVCCLVHMDIQPDSLLYAKFQADVSSKMD